MTAVRSTTAVVVDVGGKHEKLVRLKSDAQIISFHAGGRRNNFFGFFLKQEATTGKVFVAPLSLV